MDTSYNYGMQVMLEFGPGEIIYDRIMPLELKNWSFSAHFWKFVYILLAFTGILTESTVLLWMWLASCLNPFGQSDQCDKTFTHYTRIVIKGQQN